ncbi:hypothetical protein [Streptomyces clavuligerus]|uniref:hypothetical protein n=1 Tax=Streptomyces clavuligerus TaxID=1901 RepID=UPI0001800942|nr:hypothetical protein [Streptomyces clavuligerus]EDY52680.1 hypothetical protein SSCG_05724 [Streptomyces clavuligerus]WDN56032.1 hypothetical protein LL058_29550 [Streptomyces clavuligerus]
MWWEQEILADSSRIQWDWTPFEGVGPLTFGQSIEEVAAVLNEPVSGWDSSRQWAPFSMLGVDTYYDRRSGKLSAVAVDACFGPQVSFRDVRLVGRLPSELIPWIEETADTLEDLPPGLNGLHLGLNGEAALPGLGLVMRCQQNGDYARTRPVFVKREWADACADRSLSLIPDREWGVY